MFYTIYLFIGVVFPPRRRSPAATLHPLVRLSVPPSPLPLTPLSLRATPPMRKDHIIENHCYTHHLFHYPPTRCTQPTTYDDARPLSGVAPNIDASHNSALPSPMHPPTLTARWYKLLLLRTPGFPSSSGATRRGCITSASVPRPTCPHSPKIATSLTPVAPSRRGRRLTLDQ